MERKVFGRIIHLKVSNPSKEEIRKERKREANRRCAEKRRNREKEEYEELQRSVNKLRIEVQLLSEQLTTLREESKKLGEENDSIQEEISKTYRMESTKESVISSAAGEEVDEA